MANTIMASCKSLISVSSSSSRPTNKVPKLLLQVQLPKITKTQLQSLSSSTLKSLSLAAATSIAFTPPALATGITKAALFDYDLNLPIMMAKLLVLMFTNGLFFPPLGNLLDKIEDALTELLASVQEEEEEEGEEEVSQRIKAENAERTAAIRKVEETQKKVDRLQKEGKMKEDAELKEALANLEREQAEMTQLLKSQVATAWEDIVRIFRGK